MTCRRLSKLWALKKSPKFSAPNPNRENGEGRITVQKPKITSSFILINTREEMHKEMLTSEQLKLLPLLEKFSKNFGLVGGTAIALHIGHRRSIDFDLFSDKDFNNQSIIRKVNKTINIDEIIVNKLDELTFMINGVKFTFFNYPYKISYPKKLGPHIKLPDLLTLAAMKAFALGMRAKWKDYADLYFILKDHYSIAEISKKCEKIFGNNFNERIFREQLAYFDGINYKEEIEFLPGFSVSDKKIKKALVEFSLS